MATTKAQEHADVTEVFAGLGLALTKMHEIEWNLASAFLLGFKERGEKDKKPQQKIQEMWAARDKLTFGQLVFRMKEVWALDPGFERALDHFVQERNVIVHRLTTMDGFTLKTKTERERVKKRLVRFTEKSFAMARLFRGAHYFSNDFVHSHVENGNGKKKPLPPLTPEVEADMQLFLTLCDYKGA